LQSKWASAFSKPWIRLPGYGQLLFAALGSLLFLFAIYVRLIAIDPFSANVMGFEAASLVLGYVALGAALGMFGATGLLMFFVALTQFAHYYVHGNDDGYEHAFSGVIFIALGVIQLLTPRRMQQRNGGLVELDLTRRYRNGGNPQ
jgi:hypothetical protein